MAEKQQYLEGPWQRESGPVPLNQNVLNSWRHDLDNMYGAENWAAVPTKTDPDKFDIVASPDHNSVYAGVARKLDKEGTFEHPDSQEWLAELALKESGQQAQPTQPETTKL